MAGKKQTSKADLEALQNLENQGTEEVMDATEAPAESGRTNTLDGYLRIDRDQLPQHGDLYPASWQFAYRCPTSKEVANFSTINEQDQPGVVIAVEDLIRKCVVIYDTDQQRQINTGEICDAHRLYFLLLLRAYYLPGKDIEYSGFCQSCHEQFQAHLTANKLIYPELNEKLLGAYDGRVFELQMGDDVVKFRVPTLETAGRIFKYISRVYRNNAQGGEERKNDNIVFDKQFLLMAPYLYVNGNETIRDLTFKYKAIQRNDSLFKAYLEVINRLKLDNEEYFDEVCPHCGSEEETQIRFPGGFRKLFVSTTDTTGYFD